MKFKSLCATVAAGFAFFTAGCASSSKKPDSPQAPAHEAASAFPKTLSEAISSDLRTPENKGRDQFRHPQETLEFFGLKPDMTVVEVWPGGGWYTEILAPYLATSGHYIAAARPEDPSEPGDQKLHSWLLKHSDVAAKIAMTTFDPPKSVDIAPPGSADLVLTFRNVHNWQGKNAEKAAFAAFFKALKPGGVLGVVDHRAAAGKKPAKKSGYILEKDVIKFAKKAGFDLAAIIEINANPKDTKDYADGVWALPPSLRGGEKDRDKFLAIGESDRMTLKFVKPLK